MAEDGVIIRIGWRGITEFEAGTKIIRKSMQTFKEDGERVSGVLIERFEKVNGQMKKVGQTFREGERIFKSHHLSLLFFGMFLKRTFLPIWTGIFKLYEKVTKGQTALGKTTVRLAASFNFLKFSIANALGPVLIPFIEFMIGLIERFNESSDATKRVTGLIIGLVAAFGSLVTTAAVLKLGLPPLIAGFKGAVAAIAGVLGAINPLVAAIIALTALVAGFALAYKNNWLGIKDITDRVVTFLKEHPFATLIAGFMTGIGIVPAFALVWREAWEEIKRITTVVVDFITDKIQLLIDLISNLWNSMRRVVGGIGSIGGGTNIKKFQAGGVVRDTGIALLHKGERVIPPGANTANFGGINVTVNTTGGVDFG